MHISRIQKIRNKNLANPGRLISMLVVTPAEKEKRQTILELKQSRAEEIKVLTDSVILAIKINSSMLSVQEINYHMAKYVHIP